MNRRTWALARPSLARCPKPSWTAVCAAVPGFRRTTFLRASLQEFLAWPVLQHGIFNYAPRGFLQIGAGRRPALAIGRPARIPARSGPARIFDQGRPSRGNGAPACRIGLALAARLRPPRPASARIPGAARAVPGFLCPERPVSRALPGCSLTKIRPDARPRFLALCVRRRKQARCRIPPPGLRVA